MTTNDLLDLPLFARDWQSEAAIASGRGITAPQRDGTTFDQERDGKRLGEQHEAVFELMRDGKWRTLREIAEATWHPEASVSARLRDFRKDRFGGHTVNRRRCSWVGGGWWEYQLILN